MRLLFMLRVLRAFERECAARIDSKRFFEDTLLSYEGIGHRPTGGSEAMVESSDNTIRELCVRGAKELPVAIDGSYTKPRDWIGNAQAGEDIVSVVFLVTQSCGWVKSPEHGPRPQIRIALSSYDDTHRDVQVAVGVGGAYVYARCLLRSEGESFSMQPLTGKTGTTVPLVALAGEPGAEAHALFLTRSDVRFGRNRLWHLRDALLENMKEPFRSLLARGRTGHF